VIAGKPATEPHQDHDPLMRNVVAEVGPNVLTRVLARTHEAATYYVRVMQWLDELDLHADFYTKPTEHAQGKGFGGTEAARGALCDWIVLEDGKIANYQVITPTAWNIGPKDGDGVNGPMEQAFVGTPVSNVEFPVELANVAHSYDSCLVCTVHAYDGRTGKEITRFRVDGLG
jgi:hydrogenase large subunit